MFEDYQAAAWDHTALMLTAWSSKPVPNPYRRKKRRFMRPVELYAMAKALENRTRNNNGLHN